MTQAPPPPEAQPEVRPNEPPPPGLRRRLLWEMRRANKARIRPQWLTLLLFILALLFGALGYSLAPDSANEAQRRMCAIFGFGMFLWISEAIPLFSTAILIIVAEVFLLALPSGEVLGMDSDLHYKAVLSVLGNPIIYLFLGGFVLARAVQEERIDMQMAGLLLRLFGSKPGMVLAGVMTITAVFSMWMSNTATTAMMIVLVQPLVAQLPPGEKFRKGLLLAVPFAANIGGIGTIIGTPPNAIAASYLTSKGWDIDFAKWMLFAVPLMLGMLAGLWLILMLIFPTRRQRFELKVTQDFVLSRNAVIVYGTFAVTVLLWLTGSYTGISTYVAAMVPVAVFTVTGIIGRKEFNSLEWDILFLIAGGVALGEGIKSTGLGVLLVDSLPLEGLEFFWVVAAFALINLLLSTVMSNTASTALLMPVGMAAAAVATTDVVQLQVMAVLMALAASFAMSLPISTPPNAIAYGSGQIRTGDFIRIGGLVSAVAIVLIVFTGPMIVGYLLTNF